MTKSINKCPVCGNNLWNIYSLSDRLKCYQRHKWCDCIVDMDRFVLSRMRSRSYAAFFDECTECGTVVS
jgi:rRNA maturation protein Nop10